MFDQYRRQVRLPMRLLPIVSGEDCFALKGGTAINLFVRDLPRLSVDIDLMYLPRHGRPEALANIDAAMKRIEASIKEEISGARVTQHGSEGTVLRLLVIADGTQVKIEVSPVLRGVVQEPIVMSVTGAVEDAFGFAETNVVSFEDLYAGKLVAALDRQHPRDLCRVRPTLTAVFGQISLVQCRRFQHRREIVTRRPTPQRQRQAKAALAARHCHALILPHYSH